MDGNGVTHGFIESGGYFKTIDAPGATATSLLGLSNSGEAVGFDVDMNGAMHGVICNFYRAKCQLLDDPNGIGTTTFNRFGKDLVAGLAGRRGRRRRGADRLYLTGTVVDVVTRSWDRPQLSARQLRLLLIEARLDLFAEEPQGVHDLRMRDQTAAIELGEDAVDAELVL